MSNLSCGTHVAEPSANKDCRKLLNQFCRFLPKLKLPISADAKLPLTPADAQYVESGIWDSPRGYVCTICRHPPGASSSPVG